MSDQGWSSWNYWRASLPREFPRDRTTYLNLNSVEKIASKRSTGGTRPALDYSALFSIPVINDSMDNYLLIELGIELPEAEENTIQSSS